MLMSLNGHAEHNYIKVLLSAVLMYCSRAKAWPSKRFAFQLCHIFTDSVLCGSGKVNIIFDLLLVHQRAYFGLNVEMCNCEIVDISA